MKKLARVGCFVAAITAASSASAMGYGAVVAINAGIYFGTPVALARCYGLSKTPPIRMFGTEKSVYGLDWGSLSCKADDVYGGQLSMWGGGVTDSLYGLQCGILASGYVTSNNLDHCVVYGAQYGTLAAKSAQVNGMQISGVMCDAHRVNGLQFAGVVDFAETIAGIQCAGFMTKTETLYGGEIAMLCMSDEAYGFQLGIVNKAKRIDGVQIGIYNEAGGGECLQIGAVNYMPSSKLEYFPVINFRFK